MLDASRPRLRRWAANWARLAFALMPVLADLRLQPTCARHASLPLRAFSPPLAFDSTLGFPGEGPALLLWPSGFPFGLSVPLLAGLLGSGVRLQGGLWFLVCVEPAAAMETARARKAQEQRREARAGTFLEKGRPTLATTRDRRKKLQGLFEAWLRARGRTWNGLLALAKHDVEQLNEVLIWYGQWLFGNHQRLLGCLPSGTSPVASSMGHCLCLAAAGPDSPHGATLANLASYAFSCHSLGVAGCSWHSGNMLGRACPCRRGHGCLQEKPCPPRGHRDRMRVMEPKTRFKAARHQCLKIDQPQCEAGEAGLSGPLPR